MKGKPLRRRASARLDERQAVRHYASAAGLGVALRFNNALRDAYAAIVERPKSGSPRFGEILKMEGLRSRKLRAFPYLVFYRERSDLIEVLRVLHDQRDLAAVLKRNGGA